VFRYSSEGKSRSLFFFSRDARTVKQQYPERDALQQLSDDARFVVSEPVGDLPGAWVELPEASCGVVGTEMTSSCPSPPSPRLDPPRIDKICQPWARCVSRERGCEPGLVKIFTSCEDRSTPLRMGPAS
jgi:hypothetical protein